MWWIGWAEEIWHGMGIRRQPTDHQKRQEVAFEKGISMPTFEFMIYYFFPIP